MLPFFKSQVGGPLQVVAESPVDCDGGQYSRVNLKKLRRSMRGDLRGSMSMFQRMIVSTSNWDGFATPWFWMSSSGT